MSDYLYIDTANARAASEHLRSMSSTGDDHAADVRRACALAGLVDNTSTRIANVAEALANLATVIQERCDAADAGGLLPYPSTGVPLASITESLDAVGPLRPGELCPSLDSTSTSPESSEAHGWRDLIDPFIDPLIPLLQPIVDQPLPSPLDQWGGVWDRIDEAWETVDSVAQQVGDHLPEIDWSAAERFADRVLDSATDPLIIAGTVAGLPMLPVEVASYYGVVGANIWGLGVYYTRAGDGDRHLGFSVPTSIPANSPLPIPTLTFAPTSSSPESGMSVNTGACDVACTGFSIDEDLGIHPYVGVGPPGAGTNTTYTQWFNLGGGDD